MNLIRTVALTLVIGVFLPVLPAAAQPLGSFRWQLQPYCNVVTLAVVQQGGQYQLGGTDNQCDGAQQASVVGLAFQNPNGTIGFGLTIVTAPGGTPVHVDATISIATLSGSWRDSAGNTGAFTFTPGSGTGGAPRPVPSGGLAPGSVTTVQIAPAAVGTGQIAQNAVTGANVLDGSLSSADILGAPRAAFASGDQVITMTTADLVVRSVTLTIPTSGIVVVNASGYFGLLTAAADTGRCTITTGSAIDLSHLIFITDQGNGAVNTGAYPFGATRGFNVSPGTFTVNLVCDAALGSVQVVDTSITAVFIGG